VGVYQKYFFPKIWGGQNTMFGPQVNFRGVICPLPSHLSAPALLVPDISFHRPMNWA